MVTIAAHNNALWCDAVCRSHGFAGVFGPAAWTSAHPTPPYYPEAVTLRPDATADDVLPAIDTSPGCSVKDSFATLDLAAYGFTELFNARWIHRAADVLAPPNPGCGVEQVVTADRLREWQAAWWGGGDGPDVFRPALLGDPSVAVLAVRDAGTLIGGAVLNSGAGAVGVSNVFAGIGAETAVWAAVLGDAAERFRGLPVVGYEDDDHLVDAIGNGFTVLGELRVWARDRDSDHLSSNLG